MTEPWLLQARANRLSAPVHVWVHFNSGDLPGLLIGRRPRRQRGGVSRWEGLVIYASQSPASGDVDVRQAWVHFDLLRRAVTASAPPP